MFTSEQQQTKRSQKTYNFTHDISVIRYDRSVFNEFSAYKVPLFVTNIFPKPKLK